MKRQFAIATAVGLVLSAGADLSTDYSAGRTLRIESKTTISMETTDFSILRDGEPVDRNFGGGDNRSEETSTIVQLDTIVESEDGTPLKVKRIFETVEGNTSRTMGERSFDRERESPFSGLEIELTVDDGEVVVEVTDGDEPDDELLEGHRLELALDALLPDGEAAVDESWKLDAEAMQRILGVDMNPILFPPAPPEERGSRGEGGRGGGDRRSPRSMGGGGSVALLLRSDEWEAEATLVATDEETDEGIMAVIEFTASCSGDMPERRGRGRDGRDRREFSLLPETALATLRENTFEIELDGKLFFSAEEGRPVRLEVEATVVIENHSIRTRGESEIQFDSTQEGTLEYVVTVSVEGSDE